MRIVWFVRKALLLCYVRVVRTFPRISPTLGRMSTILNYTTAKEFVVFRGLQTNMFTMMSAAVLYHKKYMIEYNVLNVVSCDNIYA